MKFTTRQKFCIAKEGGNIYNFTQVQLQTPVEKNEITTFGTSINKYYLGILSVFDRVFLSLNIL